MAIRRTTKEKCVRRPTITLMKKAIYDKRFLFTAERLLHFLLSNQPDFVKNKRDSLLSNPVWEFHQLIIEKLVGSSEEIQNYYSPYEFNYDNKGKLWINERI